MFVPMLLPNEPKLMMVPPSSITSARSSIAFPPMASKATSSLYPPRASRICFLLLEFLPGWARPVLLEEDRKQSGYHRDGPVERLPLREHRQLQALRCLIVA